MHNTTNLRADLPTTWTKKFQTHVSVNVNFYFYFPLFVPHQGNSQIYTNTYTMHPSITGDAHISDAEGKFLSPGAEKKIKY